MDDNGEAVGCRRRYRDEVMLTWKPRKVLPTPKVFLSPQSGVTRGRRGGSALLSTSLQHTSSGLLQAMLLLRSKAKNVRLPPSKGATGKRKLES